MNFVSVGDMSRIFTMRHSNAELRNNIQNLSQEITTGIRTDIPKHLNGDMVALSRIEKSISQAENFRRIAVEATTTVVAMQAALENLQNIASGTGNEMLSDGLLVSNNILQSVASTTKEQLDAAVAAINIDIGGRFVFSGTKINTPPLASSEELLTQAEAIISGATTATQAIELLDNWFGSSPGAGGFSDTIYQGAVEDRSRFAIDSSTSIKFIQTANNDDVRQILFGLTIGALVSRGAFDGKHSEQFALMRAGGEALNKGNLAIISTRANLGANEQKIEQTSGKLEVLLSTLQIERSNLIQSDTYEASSRLIQAEAQLEALFTMAARLSNLSLVRYL
ncbi:MAG: flagellin [Paracoccus sp. (in: a-proteobacteria)]